VGTVVAKEIKALNQTLHKVRKRRQGWQKNEKVTIIKRENKNNVLVKR